MKMTTEIPPGIATPNKLETRFGALNFFDGVPVNKFWSLTVYDMATWAFIYTPEERPGLSSRDLDKMRLNDDGSVTLYIGPKAPKGYENNWIPTAGKVPFLLFRFYGPTEPLFNKAFILNDAELMK